MDIESSPEWFTASELMGLPQMPSTDRSIRRMALQPSRPRSYGKGHEYHISSLPAETQRALKIRAAKAQANAQVQAAARVQDSETLWQRVEQAPQSMQDKAKQKLMVLTEFFALRDSGLTSRAAEAVIAAQHGVKRATLHRWKKCVQSAAKEDWLPLLMPDYSNHRDFAECSEEAWQFFKADWLRLERPTLSDCYRRLVMAAAEHDWVIPTQRTLHNWTKTRISATTRVALREGELALLKRYPALDRSVKELNALAWINGDGYKHNVFVRWPDGEIERPKTWFWQDVYSRKILAYRVDVSEHTDQIRLSFGDLVEQYGIPKDVTIDNTRAAANKWMTGGVKTRYRFKVKEDDPRGLFPQLGINVHWTSVNLGKGHGQAKPIERAFGVGGLGEWIDKHPAFAGAYTGANTLSKPENYASKAVALDDFLMHLNALIIQWNAREGRRTEICNGSLSFDQAFNNSYRQSVIPRATEAQRRLWLLAAEAVPVKRDGTFTMDAGAKTGEGRNRYFAPELQSIGEERKKIVVRFDPQNLHDSVYCYSLDGVYITKATLWESAGFGDTEVARIYSKHRRQFIKSQKAAAKAERAMEMAAYMEKLPAPSLPDAPAAAATQLVRHAQRLAPAQSAPQDAHQQAAILEAKEILKAMKQEQAEQAQVPVFSVPDDLAERYVYWHQLDAQLRGGASLSDEQLSWHQSFPDSADYAAGQAVAELRNLKMA